LSDLLLSCPACSKQVGEQAEYCPFCGAQLDGSVDPNIGNIINDAYAIRELIGVGAIGRVYLAEQLSLKKPVALKLLRKHFARNQEVKARFEREAMAASRLTHPNSITVIDFGESQHGNLFLVTEYIRGTAMCDLIAEDEFLEPARVTAILIQVCSALVEAHGQGVIHRDLKPENIMIIRQRDGRDLVKVLDFGIAQIQRASGPVLPRLTRHGLVCGTPEYMSPEQARGEDLDPRTDIYSLGVVMYEALTGELPFEAEAAMDVVSMHLHDLPDPPCERRPEAEIPKPLQEICLMALAKDRDDRYSSALDLQQALQIVFRELGLGGELAGELPGSPDAAVISFEEMEFMESGAATEPVLVAAPKREPVTAELDALEPAEAVDPDSLKDGVRPATSPPDPAPDESGGMRRISREQAIVGTVFEAQHSGGSGLELDTSRMRRQTSPPPPSRPESGGKRLGVVVVIVLLLLAAALAAGALLGGEGIGSTDDGEADAESGNAVLTAAVQYAELSDANKSLYREANRLMVTGYYDDAARQLRRLARKEPGFADAYRQLGTCYLELEQLRKAGEAYRQFLELAPEGRNTEMVRQIIKDRKL